ncbi:MAG: hypothetical protein ABIG71_03575 [Candidatus Uhrbacteria bacterium]
MALFEKTMDKLREAFVRKRFAEIWCFGTANAARLCEQGDGPLDAELDEERFKALITWAVRQPKDPELLYTMATCIKHLSPEEAIGKLHAPVPAPLKKLLRLLDPSWAHCYPFSNFGVIVFDRGDNPVTEATLRIECRTFDKVYGTAGVEVSTSVSRSDILRAMRLAAIRGDSDECRRVRGVFCTALRDAVCMERTKAEADFNRAVAVSEDGTKIIHAGKVVVFGGSERNPTDLLFDASVFIEQKCLRVGNPPKHLNNALGALPISTMIEALSGTSTQRYTEITAYTRAQPQRQFLLCCKDGRILFVHRDQAPDPLPEGGVELRVKTE